MSRSSSKPKSMRQRRILDVAADRPNASLEEIADEVPSVNSEHVEGVIEEYGDPSPQVGSGESEKLADNDTDASPTSNQAIGPSNTLGFPEPSELTEGQYETLQAIVQNPNMNQEEIGELLNVSGATVCWRVNNIEGFDWADRVSIASAIMERVDFPRTDGGETSTQEPNDSSVIDQLSERIHAIEEQLAHHPMSRDNRTTFDDPELALKVMHACLESEKVSEEDEIDVIRSILQYSAVE